MSSYCLRFYATKEQTPRRRESGKKSSHTPIVAGRWRAKWNRKICSCHNLFGLCFDVCAVCTCRQREHNLFTILHFPFGRILFFECLLLFAYMSEWNNDFQFLLPSFFSPNMKILRFHTHQNKSSFFILFYSFANNFP